MFSSNYLSQPSILPYPACLLPLLEFEKESNAYMGHLLFVKNDSFKQIWLKHIPSFSSVIRLRKELIAIFKKPSASVLSSNCLAIIPIFRFVSSFDIHFSISVKI